MSYSVQEFTEHNLELFNQLKLEAMLENGIKSIDNDLVKVTVTKASESTSIDLKEFQKKEPVSYAELLEDYPKVTKRAESLRVVFK